MLGDVVEAKPTVPDLMAEMFDTGSDERYGHMDFADTQPMDESSLWR